MSDPAKKLPDTNVILRYLLADEPLHHEKAARFFEKVRTGVEKAVILESVLVECVYVLTKFYKVPKEEAAGKLRDLLHYKGIANSDRAELVEALTLFSQKPSFGIVDCILNAKAKRSKAALFTFDEALAAHSKRNPGETGRL